MVKHYLDQRSRKTLAEVARENNVGAETLRNWVKAYEKAHPQEEEPLTVSERARLREAERKVRDLELENEFLKKGGGLLREGASVMARYEFIDAEKATLNGDGTRRYSIRQMCRWLQVSVSGYYEWLTRPASATAQWRERLKPLIAKAFTDSDGRYGYRRIQVQLARWGHHVHEDTIRDLMRELGLVSCQPRRSRKGTTKQAAKRADIPDLINRNFTATAPGQKLVGDITYLHTWEGWVYLALVIDCYSRKIVGWAMDDNYKTPLIQAAVEMAARNLVLPPGAIFHSDRGSNYTSEEFAKTLKKLNVRQSVGRTGICYDNSLAESTNGAVKVELVNREEYPTRAYAEKEVARYIELFYNSRRFHSSLGYRTPQEVLDEYYGKPTAA
ncbi:MAG TPA: IS3 family transposase [Candidatus Deferrimicrobiaceae bacterium]|nr:IS3 family transposase [Candidatus Deferrimicrobiaceae bacterium]